MEVCHNTVTFAMYGSILKYLMEFPPTGGPIGLCFLVHNILFIQFRLTGSMLINK